MRTPIFSLLMFTNLALAGCDGDNGTDAGPVGADGGTDAGTATMRDGGDAGPIDGGPLGVPETYDFDSRSMPGVSSVAYNGQIARHVLIADLKSYIDGLTMQIDTGALDPVEGRVVSNLEYFFSLPGADRVDDPIRLTTDPAAVQMTYGDLSGSANLLEKVAGNDRSTDFRDWDTEFAGWSDASIATHGGGITSPTLLTRAFFETIEANAIARGQGVDRLSPVATPAQLPVHVTESGVDLGQVAQKFLLGAIAFHQAADDYLDDDEAGKGILSDNTMAAGTSPYTNLEHVWDEAFGYFGASRFYGENTVETFDIFSDYDMDGRINLRTEHNFGVSINANRRDRGAVVAVDFMGRAWTAFRTGRALITSADGALSEEQMTALREQRDIAEQAWEGAIAASAIHYINDTLRDMQAYGTTGFDHDAFIALARHWGEMKGFALSLQFNPRSPLTAAQFAMVHTLVGDAPVLPAAGDMAVEAYRVALRQARGILGTAYGFPSENLGDDDGVGGW